MFARTMPAAGQAREPKRAVVLIASEAVLAAWRARASATDEVIGVSVADGMDPFDVITRRQPQIVVLEESFTGTEQGAAVVGRLRTQPAFRNIDIRVLSSERLAQRHEPGMRNSLVAVTESIRPRHAVMRRTPRRKVSGDVKAEIGGSPVTLVDLSAGGVQVLSPRILRPQQRVQLVLSGSILIEANVVWVIQETTPAPQYRAGIEFVAVDARSLHQLLQSA